MNRCFISINVPEKVHEEMILIQKNLPTFQGKLTESKNLHLTLKFLGEISEGKVGEVRSKLLDVRYNSFSTEVKYIGFFDNILGETRYGPVWLHLSNCEGLQRKIDDCLADLFEKEKRFMSHLTIARVKSVEDKRDFLEQLRNIKIPKIKFVVDKFYLMESFLNATGPTYKILEEYNLSN